MRSRQAAKTGSRLGTAEQDHLNTVLADWPMVKLRDICLPTRQRTPRSDDEFDYIDVSSVSNETFTIVGSKRYKGNNAPSRARKEVRAGDVLFATIRPALKRVAIVTPQYDGQVCSTAFCILRADPKLVVPEFMYFSLLTEDFTASITAHQHGSSYPAVTDTIVLDQYVPLPPLSEQRAIAHVLSRIRAAAEAQAAIAERARELKRALMAKLFTEGLRGEPLKETEIGPVPESWEVTCLGELCRTGEGVIQTGPFGSQLHASDYRSEGHPVVNPTHMVDNRVIHAGIPKVGDEDYRRLSRHVLRKGDVLFARRGEIGRHAYITEREAGWLCGTGCFLVRVDNPAVDNEFLSYYLYSAPSQAWLKTHAVGSIMPNLNTRVLGNTPVALPPLHDQERIVATLRAVDAKIAVADQKRTRLEVLFKAMLRELLTGRVRAGALIASSAISKG